MAGAGKISERLTQAGPIVCKDSHYSYTRLKFYEKIPFLSACIIMWIESNCIWAKALSLDHFGADSGVWDVLASFCTVGESGEVSSIFICSLTKWRV